MLIPSADRIVPESVILDSVRPIWWMCNCDVRAQDTSQKVRVVETISLHNAHDYIAALCICAFELESVIDCVLE